MSQSRLFNEKTPLVPKRVKRSRQRNRELMESMAGLGTSATELLDHLMRFYEGNGEQGLRFVSKQDMCALLALASTCKSVYDYFLRQSDRPVFKLQNYQHLSRAFSGLYRDHREMLLTLENKSSPLERSVADAGQGIKQVVTIGFRGFDDSHYAFAAGIAGLCGILACVSMFFVYWNVNAVNRWAAIVDLDPTKTYTTEWTITEKGKLTFVQHSEELKVLPDTAFSLLTGVSLGVAICVLYAAYLALRVRFELSRIPLDTVRYARELYDLNQMGITPEKLDNLREHLNELAQLLSFFNPNVIYKGKPEPKNSDVSLVSFYGLGLFQAEKKAPALPALDADDTDDAEFRPVMGV